MDQRVPKGGAPPWQRILLFAVLTFLVFALFLPFQEKGRIGISYTDFKREVNNGNVEKVTFKGSQIRGEFKKPLTKDLKAPAEGASVPTAVRCYAFCEALKPARADHEGFRASLGVKVMKRVVIIGGGFAGLAAAKALSSHKKRINVTLVNRFETNPLQTSSAGHHQRHHSRELHSVAHR